MENKMENCLNCKELMYDGFTWYCHCVSCPYFGAVVKPIMTIDDYLNLAPRIEFEEGDEDDVLFI